MPHALERYHAHYHTAGTGPVYQGRFKAFPVQGGDHLFRLLRYAERNALRAGLVRQAEDWRWSSLWWRAQGRPSGFLDEGPVPFPPDWVAHVNSVETDAELQALRRSLVRGCPYGDDNWRERTARRLGLEATLQPLGRPKKETITARQQ